MKARKPVERLLQRPDSYHSSAPFFPFNLGIETPGPQPRLPQPLTCCVTLGKSPCLGHVFYSPKMSSLNQKVMNEHSPDFQSPRPRLPPAASPASLSLELHASVTPNYL